MPTFDSVPILKLKTREIINISQDCSFCSSVCAWEPVLVELA